MAKARTHRERLTASRIVDMMTAGRSNSVPEEFFGVAREGHSERVRPDGGFLRQDVPAIIVVARSSLPIEAGPVVAATGDGLAIPGRVPKRPRAGRGIVANGTVSDLVAEQRR